MRGGRGKEIGGIWVEGRRKGKEEEGGWGGREERRVGGGREGREKKGEWMTGPPHG